MRSRKGLMLRMIRVHQRIGIDPVDTVGEVRVRSGDHEPRAAVGEDCRDTGRWLVRIDRHEGGSRTRDRDNSGDGLDGTGQQDTDELPARDSPR